MCHSIGCWHEGWYDSHYILEHESNMAGVLVLKMQFMNAKTAEQTLMISLMVVMVAQAVTILNLAVLLRFEFQAARLQLPRAGRPDSRCRRRSAACISSLCFSDAYLSLEHSVAVEVTLYAPLFFVQALAVHPGRWHNASDPAAQDVFMQSSKSPS